MKTLKIGIVLLVFLLAAMVMVSMVSAAEQSNNTGITLYQNGSDAMSDASKDTDIQAIFNSAPSLEYLPEGMQNEQILNDYKSPAKMIIDLMKSKGYTDSQITDALKGHGYGWDPKTGACWKGTAPTAEEQKIIDRIRGPGYSPSSPYKSIQPLNILTDRQAYRQIKVIADSTYFGVNINMKPGNTLTSSSGTFQHVLTTHLGKKPNPSTECWIESGVEKFSDSTARRYFTYDNDEGGWQFHGNADATTLKNYMIYVTTTHDSSGYVYHVWIGNVWVRDGHVAFRENVIDSSNEIWATGSNPWTPDPSTTVFRDGYLYQASGISQWGSNVPTYFNFNPNPCPISESVDRTAIPFLWTTWI